MIIVGIGKNYVNSIHEKPADKGDPLIFTKPESSILLNNAVFKIPPVTNQVIYEVEIAARIGKKGKEITLENAISHADALALSIDFTAKDVLTKSRETKGPWALAKGFDGATPLSGFVDIANFKNVEDINFTLHINDELKQTGNTSLMIFSLAEVIAYVSSFMTLNRGDVILTGTPAHGTGEVRPGDHLVGYLEAEKMLDFKIS